ncbi:uncharacterized protein LOC101845503, partial [Aplysia californica]|uniref:Uncharacterized protein LOC101845503 n=1 Tax=Aplysia californica TaxID=6500 RepID=A0ABM1AAW4_APLCA
MVSKFSTTLPLPGQERDSMSSKDLSKRKDKIAENADASQLSSSNSLRNTSESDHIPARATPSTPMRRWLSSVNHQEEARSGPWQQRHYQPHQQLQQQQQQKQQQQQQETAGSENVAESSASSAQRGNTAWMNLTERPRKSIAGSDTAVTLAEQGSARSCDGKQHDVTRNDDVRSHDIKQHSTKQRDSAPRKAGSFSGRQQQPRIETARGGLNMTSGSFLGRSQVVKKGPAQTTVGHVEQEVSSAEADSGVHEPADNMAMDQAEIDRLLARSLHLRRSKRGGSLRRGEETSNSSSHTVGMDEGEDTPILVYGNNDDIHFQHSVSMNSKETEKPEVLNVSVGAYFSDSNKGTLDAERNTENVNDTEKDQDMSKVSSSIVSSDLECVFDESNKSVTALTDDKSEIEPKTRADTKSEIPVRSASTSDERHAVGAGDTVSRALCSQTLVRRFSANDADRKQDSAMAIPSGVSQSERIALYKEQRRKQLAHISERLGLQMSSHSGAKPVEDKGDKYSRGERGHEAQNQAENLSSAAQTSLSRKHSFKLSSGFRSMDDKDRLRLKPEMPITESETTSSPKFSESVACENLKSLDKEPKINYANTLSVAHHPLIANSGSSTDIVPAQGRGHTSSHQTPESSGLSTAVTSGTESDLIVCEEKEVRSKIESLVEVDAAVAGTTKVLPHEVRALAGALWDGGTPKLCDASQGMAGQQSTPQQVGELSSQLALPPIERFDLRATGIKSATTVSAEESYGENPEQAPSTTFKRSLTCPDNQQTFTNTRTEKGSSDGLAENASSTPSRPFVRKGTRSLLPHTPKPQINNSPLEVNEEIVGKMKAIPKPSAPHPEAVVVQPPYDQSFTSLYYRRYRRKPEETSTENNVDTSKTQKSDTGAEASTVRVTSMQSSEIPSRVSATRKVSPRSYVGRADNPLSTSVSVAVSSDPSARKTGTNVLASAQSALSDRLSKPKSRSQSTRHSPRDHPVGTGTKSVLGSPRGSPSLTQAPKAQSTSKPKEVPVAAPAKSSPRGAGALPTQQKTPIGAKHEPNGTLASTKSRTSTTNLTHRNSFPARTVNANKDTSPCALPGTLRTTPKSSPRERQGVNIKQTQTVKTPEANLNLLADSHRTKHSTLGHLKTPSIKSHHDGIPPSRVSSKLGGRANLKNKHTDKKDSPRGLGQSDASRGKKDYSLRTVAAKTETLNNKPALAALETHVPNFKRNSLCRMSLPAQLKTFQSQMQKTEPIAEEDSPTGPALGSGKRYSFSECASVGKTTSISARLQNLKKEESEALARFQKLLFRGRKVEIDDTSVVHTHTEMSKETQECFIKVDSIEEAERTAKSLLEAAAPKHLEGQLILSVLGQEEEGKSLVVFGETLDARETSKVAGKEKHRVKKNEGKDLNAVNSNNATVQIAETNPLKPTKPPKHSSKCTRRPAPSVAEMNLSDKETPPCDDIPARTEVIPNTRKLKFQPMVCQPLLSAPGEEREGGQEEVANTAEGKVVVQTITKLNLNPVQILPQKTLSLDDDTAPIETSSKERYPFEGGETIKKKTHTDAHPLESQRYLSVKEHEETKKITEQSLTTQNPADTEHTGRSFRSGDGDVSSVAPREFTKSSYIEDVRDTSSERNSQHSEVLAINEEVVGTGRTQLESVSSRDRLPVSDYEQNDTTTWQTGSQPDDLSKSPRQPRTSECDRAIRERVKECLGGQSEGASASLQQTRGPRPKCDVKQNGDPPKGNLDDTVQSGSVVSNSSELSRLSRAIVAESTKEDFSSGVNKKPAVARREEGKATTKSSAEFSSNFKSEINRHRGTFSGLNGSRLEGDPSECQTLLHVEHEPAQNASGSPALEYDSSSSKRPVPDPVEVIAVANVNKNKYDARQDFREREITASVKYTDVRDPAPLRSYIDHVSNSFGNAKSTVSLPSTRAGGAFVFGGRSGNKTQCFRIGGDPVSDSVLQTVDGENREQCGHDHNVSDCVTLGADVVSVSCRGATDVPESLYSEGQKTASHDVTAPAEVELSSVSDLAGDHHKEHDIRKDRVLKKLEAEAEAKPSLTCGVLSNPEITLGDSNELSLKLETSMNNIVPGDVFTEQTDERGTTPTVKDASVKFVQNRQADISSLSERHGEILKTKDKEPPPPEDIRQVKTVPIVSYPGSGMIESPGLPTVTSVTDQLNVYFHSSSAEEGQQILTEAELTFQEHPQRTVVHDVADEAADTRAYLTSSAFFVKGSPRSLLKEEKEELAHEIASVQTVGQPELALDLHTLTHKPELIGSSTNSSLVPDNQSSSDNNSSENHPPEKFQHPCSIEGLSPRAAKVGKLGDRIKFVERLLNNSSKPDPESGIISEQIGDAQSALPKSGESSDNAIVDRSVDFRDLKKVAEAHSQSHLKSSLEKPPTIPDPDAFATESAEIVEHKDSESKAQSQHSSNLTTAAINATRAKSTDWERTSETKPSKVSHNDFSEDLKAKKLQETHSQRSQGASESSQEDNNKLGSSGKAKGDSVVRKLSPTRLDSLYSRLDVSADSFHSLFLQNALYLEDASTSEDQERAPPSTIRKRRSLHGPRDRGLSRGTEEGAKRGPVKLKAKSKSLRETRESREDEGSKSNNNLHQASSDVQQVRPESDPSEFVADKQGTTPRPNVESSNEGNNQRAGNLSVEEFGSVSKPDVSVPLIDNFENTPVDSFDRAVSAPRDKDQKDPTDLEEKPQGLLQSSLSENSTLSAPEFKARESQEETSENVRTAKSSVTHEVEEAREQDGSEEDMDARRRRKLLERTSDVSTEDSSSWRSRVYQKDVEPSRVERSGSLTSYTGKTSRSSYHEETSTCEGRRGSADVSPRDSTRRRSEDTSSADLAERLAKRRAQRLEEQGKSSSQEKEGSVDSPRTLRDRRRSRDSSALSQDSVENGDHGEDRLSVRRAASRRHEVVESGGSGAEGAGDRRHRCGSRDSVISADSVDSSVGEDQGRRRWSRRRGSDEEAGSIGATVGSEEVEAGRNRRLSSRDSCFQSAESGQSLRSVEGEDRRSSLDVVPDIAAENQNNNSASRAFASTSDSLSVSSLTSSSVRRRHRRDVIEEREEEQAGGDVPSS